MQKSLQDIYILRTSRHKFCFYYQIQAKAKIDKNPGVEKMHACADFTLFQ